MKKNNHRNEKEFLNQSLKKRAEGIKDLLSSIQKKASQWLNTLFREQKLTSTRKTELLDYLKESSSPGVDFFVLIVLSCTIATLGLVSDSAAVIIGAMLVAPLMTPILGLSMASINGHSRLFRRSLAALTEGAGLAVLLSLILTLIAYRLPFGIQARIPDEVMARTSPSPIDLGIALAGGAAAAYALAHPRLTAALPGVAIATALMPPLCTVGIGIAFLNPAIFLGALLLFVTNLVTIAFAGIVTFAAMGFGPRGSQEDENMSRSVTIAAFLVLLIGLLLAGAAWQSINEAHMYNQVSQAIMDSISQYTTASLVDLNVTTAADAKVIKATIRTTHQLGHSQVLALQSDISDRLQSPVALELVTIPMQVLDPQNTPTPTPTMTNTPVLSPTPTLTPLPSSTPEPTLEPSATPAPAFITTSSRRGADIFDAPKGNLLFHLPENSAVWVLLENQEILDGNIWVKIWDVFQRSGWLPAAQLDLILP